MYMLEMGKQTNNFFASYNDEYGRKRYRLKSIEQYSRENNTNEQPGKKYFAATTLPDIIKSAAGSGKGKLTENDKGEFQAVESGMGTAAVARVDRAPRVQWAWRWQGT